MTRRTDELTAVGNARGEMFNQFCSSTNKYCRSRAARARHRATSVVHELTDYCRRR